MATIDGLITELGHIKVWCEAQVTVGVPKDDIAQAQFELLRSNIRLVSTKAIDIEKGSSSHNCCHRRKRHDRLL